MAGRSPAGSSAAGGRVILFDIPFRHTYYNLNQGMCPDLGVVPTPECKSLTDRLGIQWTAPGNGLIVSIPSARLASLLNFLTNAQTGGTTVQLGFFLMLNNPDFIGFTRLPLDTSPGQSNLYVDNLETSGRKNSLCFGPKGGLGAGQIYPIASGGFSVTTSRAATVSLANQAGATVASVATQPGIAATLSLAALPHGLYGVSASPASAYKGPAQILHMPKRPGPLGLMELALVMPPSASGANAAAFPINLATGKASTAAISLAFEARQTTWQYYVMSQDGRGEFEGQLSITGNGTSFDQAQAPVAMPNGQQAVLFSSSTALPLRQASPYRFRLSGQRRSTGGSRDAISIDRLPCADKAPVWPSPSGDALSGASEIFVPV
jgi:hypothetical protein